MTSNSTFSNVPTSVFFLPPASANIQATLAGYPNRGGSSNIKTKKCEMRGGKKRFFGWGIWENDAEATREFCRGCGLSLTVGTKTGVFKTLPQKVRLNCCGQN